MKRMRGKVWEQKMSDEKRNEKKSATQLSEWKIIKVMIVEKFFNKFKLTN